MAGAWLVGESGCLEMLECEMWFRECEFMIKDS